MTKKGAIIVARHGERIDYYLRDAGSNWLAGTERKWDPPLTHRGQMQGRKLGEYLHEIIESHDLAPIRAVYSSPMVRCCMTAGEAALGYTISKGGGGDDKINVIVEEGLVESMNEKWYRSWGLQGSDGTWGGPPGHPPSADVDVDSMHPLTQVPAHSTVRDPKDISHFLKDYTGHPDDASLSGIQHEFKESKNVASLICSPSSASTKPVFSLSGVDYKWNNFETTEAKQDRLENVVETLSKRHPDETILLVSHGAPVTNLYERLTGNHASSFGVATYTSFTIYEKEEDETAEASWKAISTNDSTHMKRMNMDTADGTTSFV